MRMLYRLAAKAGYAVDDQAAGEGGGALQVAAVPYRLAPNGAIELLLITSRSSGRWIVPKGWPVKGLTFAESAAREAFEEAGVRGRVATRELARIALIKPASAIATRELAVFALRVGRLLDDWPERRQRHRRWHSAAEAAEMVAIPGVPTILRDFAAAESGRAG